MGYHQTVKKTVVERFIPVLTVQPSEELVPEAPVIFHSHMRTEIIIVDAVEP